MTITEAVPSQYREPERAELIELIAQSHHRIIGKPLVDETDDVIEALWRAPDAILAHGTDPDPVFFFANARALEVFEYDLETMLRTPSRLSAEAPLREERRRLLDRVGDKGFIDDYSGIRISATGRRFRIGPATVWNLLDEQGIRHGQAATFAI